MRSCFTGVASPRVRGRARKPPGLPSSPQQAQLLGRRSYMWVSIYHLQIPPICLHLPFLFLLFFFHPCLYLFCPPFLFRGRPQCGCDAEAPFGVKYLSHRD
ncbi:hypothetical protein SETIT_9G328100v2 [Setaria italica]|uniref:Uncharacterized protein n=1 Tax=Setaria italica TaxID=4555 RepID=A0A368SNB7_SETIT|nr:hypothetical protein SETIT_9G328100v2 [Setaria italica]